MSDFSCNFLNFLEISNVAVSSLPKKNFIIHLERIFGFYITNFLSTEKWLSGNSNEFTRSCYAFVTLVPKIAESTALSDPKVSVLKLDIFHMAP